MRAKVCMEGDLIISCGIFKRTPCCRNLGFISDKFQHQISCIADSLISLKVSPGKVSTYIFPMQTIFHSEFLLQKVDISQQLEHDS